MSAEAKGDKTMATADHGEATISSEALSLLSCFSDGIDDLVLRIAGGVARSRLPQEDHPEISGGDIIAAGNVLSKALRNAPEMPEDVKPAIEAMLQCVAQKAQNRRH
jgi:hypothetical protein